MENIKTMKKAILMLSLIIVATNVSIGQDFGADKSIIHETNATLFIGDLETDELTIYETKNGSQYIIQIGKSGNEYPVWIGTKTDEQVMHNGFNHTVRLSKSGKRFILLRGKTSGNIYAKYL